MMTNSVKLYRLKGYYIKQKRKIPLSFECRATRVADAVEKAYSEIGSRHRVKRSRIFIDKENGVFEISPEEAKDPLFMEIDDEDFKITTS